MRLPPLMPCVITFTFLYLADVVLMHNGRVFLNNSLILLESIGNNDTALMCVTTDPFCCETNRSGNWFPPQGATPLGSSSSSVDLYQSWEDDQSIRLNKPGDANLAQLNEGLYRCEVPDRNGVTQVLYAGLYSETRGSKFTVNPEGH